MRVRYQRMEDNNFNSRASACRHMSKMQKQGSHRQLTVRSLLLQFPLRVLQGMEYLDVWDEGVPRSRRVVIVGDLRLTYRCR